MLTLPLPVRGPRWRPADQLHQGHVIADPTGELGLHDEIVVVTGTGPSELDRNVLLIDYAVPGSTAVGCFTRAATDHVWVLRGGARR